MRYFRCCLLCVVYHGQSDNYYYHYVVLNTCSGGEFYGNDTVTVIADNTTDTGAEVIHLTVTGSWAGDCFGCGWMSRYFYKMRVADKRQHSNGCWLKLAAGSEWFVVSSQQTNDNHLTDTCGCRRAVSIIRWIPYHYAIQVNWMRWRALRVVVNGNVIWVIVFACSVAVRRVSELREENECDCWEITRWE